MVTVHNSAYVKKPDLSAPHFWWVTPDNQLAHTSVALYLSSLIIVKACENMTFESEGIFT